MSGYWALRRAVTDALDAEIGDDVVALRRMLMDALKSASAPEEAEAGADRAPVVVGPLAAAFDAVGNLYGYQHALAWGCDKSATRGRAFGAHVDAILDLLRDASAELERAALSAPGTEQARDLIATDGTDSEAAESVPSPGTEQR